MANPEDVISASKYARKSINLSSVVFNSGSVGSIWYVLLFGSPIIECDTKLDSETLAAELNQAIAPVVKKYKDTTDSIMDSLISK